MNMAPGSLERARSHRTGTGSQRLTPQNLSGLNKKSNSTSQLSATGMMMLQFNSLCSCTTNYSTNCVVLHSLALI